MSTCNVGGGDGTQGSPFCPTTIDEVMPGVVGLMPPGFAWDAVAIDGTNMNRFWRSIAGMIAYANERMCAFLEEFYCATAKESLDQWNEEYGMGGECDPWGSSLCAKVAAEGGQDCTTFVQLALDMKWVITCDDQLPEPICGCFECGCTPMGPTPVLYEAGSNIGCGEFCGCLYGSVAEHPEPEHWHRDDAKNATCWVPGSELGQSSGDGISGCCFIVGYYELPEEAVRGDNGYCALPGDTVRFDCPTTTPTPLKLDFCDSTKRYAEWGLAHHWRITVDMAASRLLQGDTTKRDVDDNSCAAGQLIAGCTYIEAPVNPVVPLLCFLEDVKPAHTILHTEMINA